MQHLHNASLRACILIKATPRKTTSSDSRSWWRTKYNTCTMHPYALTKLSKLTPRKTTSSDSRSWRQTKCNTCTMHPYALIKLSKPHLRRQHRVTRGHGGELNATLAQCILTRLSNYQIHTSEDTSSDTRSWWRTKCNTCAMHPYALTKLSKPHLGRQHRLTRGHGGKLNATLAQCILTRLSNYQSHTSEDNIV